MTPSYLGRPRMLVGYDGSDDACAALRYAVKEALAVDAELALVYAVDDTVLNSVWGVVFDPEEIKENAEVMIQEALADIEALGVDSDSVRTEIVLGNPASALAKYSEFASKVFLGRCSESKDESEFAGSTAVGVAGTASCPVVIVSAKNEPGSQPFGKIGVGVNIGAKGRRGLPWAMQEAKRIDAELRIISVIRVATRGLLRSGSTLSPEQRDDAMKVARIRVESIRKSLTEKYPGVVSEIEIEFGSPVDYLVKRSGELDYLVLEVQSSFPSNSVGGVTRGVMAHAKCPVVLIRAKSTR
ncbi:MAG: universal stress protein [Propionibacteriaceae bacterium]|nr:universal stress protein [Propionibacteriaceae bacterium]